MIRTNTSASNFHRRVGCPGSANIERPLPEPTSTKDADRGTELHRLWADPTLSREHLEDEDREALESVEKMAKEFDESIGIRENGLPIWEEPYSLFRATPHEMINHPDRVTLGIEFLPINRYRFGVTDAKFGRIEVDAAEDNWQLVVYACSMLESLERRFTDATPGIHPPKLDAVFDMAILQPWASRQVKPVRMTIEEVRALRDQIWETCESGLAPNAALTPSLSNCRYCKGALHGVCPAYQANALAPVKDANAVAKAIENPEAFLTSIEPDKRTQLLDALAMAADLGDVIRPAARALLRQDPRAIPGYKVGKDTETRKIANPWDLVHALSRDYPEAQADVVGACSVSITAATKLFKAASGLKGKELEEAVEKFLHPICDKSPRTGSLERE